MQDTASQFGPFFDGTSTSDIVVMAGEVNFLIMLQHATSACVCCRSDCDVLCRLAQRRAQLMR